MLGGDRSIILLLLGILQETVVCVLYDEGKQEDAPASRPCSRERERGF